MIKNIKNNYAIIFGLCVIVTYYFIIVVNYKLSSGENIFLSLAIFSDSSYLNLILNEKVLTFQEGMSFSLIPYVIERKFIDFFGIDRLWLIIIIYKLISFLVLLIGFKSLLKVKKTSLILFSLCLAIFCCIDLPPFNDRYPRPQFSNIFLFSILIFNLHILNNQKFSTVLYFVYGAFHVVLAITYPWAAAVISPMSLIAILKTRSALKITYSALGFLVFMIPILLYYSSNLTNSAHSEYLGLKTIHEPLLFVQDYFSSVLLSKQFILLFVLLLVSSFFLKRRKELVILSICLITAPTIFLIIGKSIQSYHLVEGIKEFQILICITSFLYLLNETTLKISSFKIKNSNFILASTSLAAGVLLIGILGNSWIDRSQHFQKEWQQYESTYEFLEDIPPNCRLLSNDYNIRLFWLNFLKGEVFPKDGFIRTSDISKTLDEVRISVRLLNTLNPLEPYEVNELLKFATHNYYVTTRSTYAESLSFSNKKEREAYLKSRENVNSMQPWSFAPPREVYEYINNSNDSAIKEHDDENIMVIYKGTKNNISSLKIINNCSKNDL